MHPADAGTRGPDDPLGDGPLIVGHGGGERSRDALALARLLGATLGSEVIAVSVLTYAPSEATWTEYERTLRSEQDRLETEAREALAGLRSVSTVSVSSPSPARELHALASARGASAIVLGSTHRGSLGRVLPGSVAERLLAGAPCPITVAPRGYAGREASLESIAVAYDGSAESRLALAVGTALASASDGTLELVAVANPHDARIAAPGAGGWSGLVLTEEAIEGERLRVQGELDRALESIPEGLAASGEVTIDFDPASAILTASERADLLALGSRGYGPLGRVLLGGVSSSIMRGASCPVIVTPRALTESENAG